MGNSIDINRLTLKQILDLYSSEKLRRTLAGGTFSARLNTSPFTNLYQAALPGNSAVSDIDPDALLSMIEQLLDSIE
jgi:hypothetical protein